ncbi:hypothetical protein [Methylobacterium sp. Leaf93]|uniref:tetratricopeptide repeat protein n=1 Tax=Methylobacterium sp. Leaf93 TaxID=1736249 RepID=UPI0006FCC25F|nr:hypothetical protein [Methylobacterium sp. Leaf93]KQP08428.1 hypothetical protein ASF26_21380 [Methylobacterium sp. Leaf93]
MLILENVWVRSLQSRSHAVLCGLSGVIPTNRRVGILCASKIERRAFSDLIAGVRQPAVGKMRREADISSPVGRMAGIVAFHTLRRNCVFAAKMHRIEPGSLIKFVAFVANIDAFMDVPYKHVPADIALAFRYALSYGLPYETYFVDGDILPQTAEFTDRFASVIKQRSATSGFIVISSNVAQVREFCDVVGVVQADKIVLYSNAQRAIHEYMRLVDLNKPDVDATETLLARIRRALKLEDWPMVAAIATSEMQDDPDSPTAIWLYGELALSRGDRRRGIDLIIRACQSNPSFEEPWKALARVAEDEQDEERLKLLASVLMTNGQCRILRMAAKIIEQTGTDAAAVDAWRRVAAAAQTDVGVLIEAGDRLLRAGAGEDAARIFEAAYAADPTNGRLLVMLYRSELLFSDNERLAELTALIVEFYPEEAERAVRLAQRARRPEVKAIEDGSAPTPLDSAVEEALPVRIRRALKQQDVDTLAEIAEAEIRREADGATGIWLLGEIALIKGDRERGGDLILRACQADAELEDPWKTLGRLAEEEKNEERLSSFVSALMTNSQGRIRRLAAKALEPTGDEESILAAWRAVAHVAGTDLGLVLEAGDRLFRYGAAGEGAQVLSRALQVDPRNGRVLMLLYRCELTFSDDERLMALVGQINEVAAPAEVDRAIRLAANARKVDLGKRMKERFKQPAPSDASA